MSTLPASTIARTHLGSPASFINACHRMRTKPVWTPFCMLSVWEEPKWYPWENSEDDWRGACTVDVAGLRNFLDTGNKTSLTLLNNSLINMNEWRVYFQSFAETKWHNEWLLMRELLSKVRLVLFPVSKSFATLPHQRCRHLFNHLPSSLTAII